MIIDKLKNLFTGDNDLYCYTSLPNVLKHGEITSVKSQQPSWWRNLPAKLKSPNWKFPLKNSFNEFDEYLQDLATIKQCPAVSENLNSGILLKAWCDIKIFVSPDGIVDSVQASEETSSQRPPGSVHPYIQRAGFLKNMAHYKIHSPWLFNTKKHRKFYFQGAYMWNTSLVENGIFVVPGFIDYYAQTGTEINLFLPIRNTSYVIDIKLGDPLVHLFPIDNNPVNIKRELKNDNELRKISNVHLKFVGSSKLLKSRNKK